MKNHKKEFDLMCYDILYYLLICFTASDKVHLDVDCNEK